MSPLARYNPPSEQLTRYTLFLSLLLLSGCPDPYPPRPTRPVLISTDHLDQFLNQEVTICGEVTNTKQATILGIDVESSSPDLRGQQAQATGILQKYVITAKDLQDLQKNGPIPNRGPGTFYRLKAIDSDYDAAVRPTSP